MSCHLGESHITKRKATTSFAVRSTSATPLVQQPLTRSLGFAGDLRFDASGSSTVAHLSQSDTLYSLHVRSDLASARQTCLANTVRLDRDSGVGWVASTSVDDPLVSVSPAQLSTLHHIWSSC